ncbi:MAG: polysaccharide biosynthesis tyrosine autokinase [Xanthomonadales bacterium]|jgi:capsular exopolysaccharide synthesis family protein|nr:polysaccharide biosynthesis tyrosine autokinase [Xanthomonadales bacterium]
MSTPLHAVDPPYKPPSRPPDSSPQDEPFPLLDYLQLLWFRRRLIAVVTLLVAVLGYLYVNQLQSIYTARSDILIGVTDSQPLDFQQAIYQRYFGLDTQQEMEVLRSRRLAQKTVERLNLLALPEFNPSLRDPDEGQSWTRFLNPVNWIPDGWLASLRGASTGEVVVAEPSEEEQAEREMVRAVNIFLSKLDVAAVELTSIINLTFSSPDPKLAARIANEHPETYIRDKLEAKLESAERLSTWLSEQLRELEQNVRDSEQAVEIYRIEQGLTEGATGDLLTQQLSAINSQLIIARAERAEAEARLAQVERLLVADASGLETASEVLSSPMIQQLRSQEAEVQRRISELSVEYGPKHPRMLQVNAELGDVRNRIDEEIQKVVLGLENELEVARTREASLEDSLREAESETGVQNREAIQLRALEREAAANRTLYETFLTRFKETTTTEGTETPDARVLSNAVIPGSPSSPNRQRILLLISLLGFLGACGLVIGLHLLSPGMLTPEQIEQQLGVHTIGLMPKLPKKTPPHEHVTTRDGSGFVEAINSLKISLKLSDPDTKIQAIQITSSVPEEGKTSLVLALGLVLARQGHKVIVVDGDLRRSSVEDKLGVDAKGPGLTDFVIAETDDVTGFITTHEESGMDLMRTGEGKYVSATDLFASHRMQHVIDLLKERYDYILIDAPPVMAVADARVIGQVADKTLFVVRWNQTPKKVARAALDLLRKSGVPLAGVVLQQVDLKRYGRLGYGDSGYYYHYGRYGQYYS